MTASYTTSFAHRKFKITGKHAKICNFSVAGKFLINQDCVKMEIGVEEFINYPLLR